MTWAEAEALYPECSAAWDRDIGEIDGEIDLITASCMEEDGPTLFASRSNCPFSSANVIQALTDTRCNCIRFSNKNKDWVVSGPYGNYRP